MFGWTFTEADEQPADEVLQYLQLKSIAEGIAKLKNGG